MPLYMVKVSFPDLIHPPNDISAWYEMEAASKKHAIHRAYMLAKPSVAAMLRKVHVEPILIDCITNELVIIEGVIEPTNQ